MPNIIQQQLYILRCIPNKKHRIKVENLKFLHSAYVLAKSIPLSEDSKIGLRNYALQGLCFDFPFARGGGGIANVSHKMYSAILKKSLTKDEFHLLTSNDKMWSQFLINTTQILCSGLINDYGGKGKGLTKSQRLDKIFKILRTF